MTNFWKQLFPFLGLLKNSTQNQSADPEVLQETIGERIISRSRLCQYAVIRNNTNLLNNHQICNECKILFPSNENHEVKEEIIISDDEGKYLLTTFSFELVIFLELTHFLEIRG